MDDFVPHSMAGVAERHAEALRLRREHDHLFAAERRRLQDRIDALETASRQRIADLERQLATAEVKIGTLAYEQRERAKRAKQRNRVIFDVTAIIVPDAASTRDAMLRRYGPGKSDGGLTVTECHADGQTLLMEIDYTVKGGHPADVERALGRALKDSGAELMGPAEINVLSREVLAEAASGSARSVLFSSRATASDPPL